MTDPNAKAPPARKGPSVGLVLAALVMVLLSVGVVLWQIPLTACPTCTSPAVRPPSIPVVTAKPAPCPTCRPIGVTVDRFRAESCPTCKAPPVNVVDTPHPGPCVTCNGTGKISFVKKWGYDRLKVDVSVPDILK
jgi:hypothetical protein